MAISPTRHSSAGWNPEEEARKSPLIPPVSGSFSKGDNRQKKNGSSHFRKGRVRGISAKIPLLNILHCHRMYLDSMALSDIVSK